MMMEGSGCVHTSFGSSSSSRSSAGRLSSVSFSGSGCAQRPGLTEWESLDGEEGQAWDEGGDVRCPFGGSTT